MGAKAPESVPKGLAGISISLPGPFVHGLGFRPTYQVVVPSPVTSVIMPHPAVNVLLSPAIEEFMYFESPPSVDIVHPTEFTVGIDPVFGQDLAGDLREISRAPAVPAVTQVVSSVPTEEPKAKIAQQTCGILAAHELFCPMLY